MKIFIFVVFLKLMFLQMELWSWLVPCTNFRNLGSIFASGLGNRVCRSHWFWPDEDTVQVQAVHPLQKPREVPLGRSGWVKWKFLAVSRKEKYIPSLLYQAYWICNFDKYVRWGCGFATSILFWSTGFGFQKKILSRFLFVRGINLLSLKAKYTSCSFYAMQLQTSWSFSLQILLLRRDENRKLRFITRRCTRHKDCLCGSVVPLISFIATSK